MIDDSENLPANASDSDSAAEWAELESQALSSEVLDEIAEYLQRTGQVKA